MGESSPEFFELDIAGLPPSVNALYSTIGKFRVKSKVGREYERMVWTLVRNTYGSYIRDKYFQKQWNRAIKLELYFHKPSWHCTTKGKTHQFLKRDCSNFIKSAEDSIMKALGLEDSCVVDLTAKKVSGAEMERTHVRLWFLGDGWT